MASRCSPWLRWLGLTGPLFVCNGPPAFGYDCDNDAVTAWTRRAVDFQPLAQMNPAAYADFETRRVLKDAGYSVVVAADSNLVTALKVIGPSKRASIVSCFTEATDKKVVVGVAPNPLSENPSGSKKQLRQARKRGLRARNSLISLLRRDGTKDVFQTVLVPKGQFLRKVVRLDAESECLAFINGCAFLRSASLDEPFVSGVVICGYARNVDSAEAHDVAKKFWSRMASADCELRRVPRAARGLRAGSVRLLVNPPDTQFVLYPTLTSAEWRKIRGEPEKAVLVCRFDSPVVEDPEAASDDEVMPVWLWRSSGERLKPESVEWTNARTAEQVFNSPWGDRDKDWEINISLTGLAVHRVAVAQGKVKVEKGVGASFANPWTAPSPALDTDGQR